MGCAASAPRTSDPVLGAPASTKAPSTKEAAAETADKSKSPLVAQVDNEDGHDLIKAKPITEDAEEGKEKSRSRMARARRLSYVDHSEGSKFDEHSGQGQGGQSGDNSAEGDVAEAAAVKRSKDARRRRLSYVVDEKDPKLRANFDTAQAKADMATAKTPPATGSSKAAPEEELSRLMPTKPIDSSALEGYVKLSTACISRAGREPGFKKQNQDNCFSFDKYTQEGRALFGAFDGHGPEGHTISGYVKQQLPILLINSLKTAKDIPAALKNCFLEVDKAMNATKIDCEFSGSTACVAFLEGRVLNVAWVGDSRGVMGRARAGGIGYEAVDMTSDHKPTCEDERARIIASSGRVERLVDESGQPIGPFRVWLQYAWIPGLAMSRALGDALAHQVGVISEPEVFTTVLGEEDAFIILASDGVWEFIDSQAAVNIIGSAASAEEGCRQLVDEAFQRWLVEEEGVVDDITAVVVKLDYKA